MSPRDSDVGGLGASPAAAQPLLQFADVGKSYPGVKALSDITLDFHAGQIHSIVGENGAGKSTLVGMLAGVVHPDSGRILVEGSTARLRNPRQARLAGVSFVPQEAEGIPTFTLGRSLMLGREGAWINRSRLAPAEQAMATEALARMGVSGLDLNAPLARLSVAQIRLAQIAGTLLDPGRLIVLDEPTAVLADADADILLQRLERLRDDGKSILYVSHRLGEVLRISDRITVLRDGKVVGSFARGQIDRAGLLALMARRQGTEQAAPQVAEQAGAPRSQAEPRLRVSALGRSRAFTDVSFEVGAGQIVGIAGIAGSGHGKLVEAIAGALALDSGTITVDGAPVRPGSLGHALRAGLRLVPEDRRARGIVGPRSVRENLSIGLGTQAQRRFLRRPAAERAAASRAIGDLDIRTPGTEILVRNLSGGNQQKVVIARVLASSPTVMLLSEPTQGIDVTSKAEILRLLRRVAIERGIGIVLASSEFEELLDYADVIHVMRAGRIVKTVEAGLASYADLLEAAVP